MIRLLRIGSAGSEVKDLQTLLNLQFAKAGAPLVVDGIFGRQTDARTREFQRLKRLRVDGIVGPQTSTALLFLICVDIRDGWLAGKFVSRTWF
jgi:peptidoglycan hydrolase-like protein with peptidoglycan-binding domain